MGRGVKTVTNMMKVLFCVFAFLTVIHANTWPQPDPEKCMEMMRTSFITSYYKLTRTCKEPLTTWALTCKEEIMDEFKKTPTLIPISGWKEQELLKGKMLQCLKKRSEDAVPEGSFCFDCLCKMINTGGILGGLLRLC